MSEFDQSTAIRAIKLLKARYFRFVDTQAWPQFRALFADDATLFFPENSPSPVSIDMFMPHVTAALKGGTSIHHGHTPEIELMTENTARGIWAMEDWLFFPPDVAGIAAASEIHGWGHYHETYFRIGQVWLFQTIKLTRLKLDVKLKSRTVT